MPDSQHNPRGVTRLLLVISCLLSAALGAAYLIQPALINSTTYRTTDAVMALAPSPPPSGAVVIVDIDDASLSRHGQWPWPRDHLARLLATIDAAGAATTGLDLILAEPDRSSPASKTSDQVNKTSSRAAPGRQPDRQDHDRQLAETLSTGRDVLGYEFLFGIGAKPAIPCDLHPPGMVMVNIPDADRDLGGFFTAQGVVCNRRLFSSAVTHSGFLNATPDADGILRRVPMLIRFENRFYPSLTLAILMKSTQSSQIGIWRTGSGRLDLKLATRSIPVDTQGNMIVRFSRPDIIPRISAGDLLSGTAPLHQLTGKHVLVGSSASGLQQLYQTAVNPVHSHASIHAQVLDNLLTGQQVIRTKDFLTMEALIGLLAATCTALFIAKLGILPSAMLCTALLAGSWTGMVYLFSSRGYLFSPLLPTVLVVLNYAVLTIVKTWKMQLSARNRADSTLILLKSSEKNLNSIITAIPDIVFRLNTKGLITFISPAISKYASSPDDLLGHPIFDLVAPDDLPKAHHHLNEKRTGARATHSLELRLLLPHTPDGTNETAGYFSVSAEGIYQGDTPCPDRFIGTQGIIRDINEQKLLEEKLLQAQKLEAIGSLAAGVAHDLNNILAGLVTYPDLLLLELPTDSPLRDKIALLQRSGQRAAAIVQDLLTLGRRGIQTGELVNLNLIILEYLVSLECDTTMKHHPQTTLERNLAPDLLNITGSRTHLTKAIMNLVTNAAEAMPTGGTIRISSYNRCLDTSLLLYEEIPPGEYACVSVSDEGIGISTEDLHRIFEPFYSKKSMRRSGSGLGMTVIWATIKDLGGYIDLQSREGEGTCFVLYLPATRRNDEQPARRIVLEDYLGTERVLVVDDMPDQRQIAANMLSKLGYAVVTVASGEAAVEHLRRETADLVVLDIIMPCGMDGLETYRKIIEIKPGQKAIITSGFSESERVKALQQEGAGVYVQKPYTLENLGVAVRKELDRS